MTILCGTDFSPGARAALRAACALARRAKDSVELVHVIDLQAARALMAQGDSSTWADLDGEFESWSNGATRRLAEEAGSMQANGVAIATRVLTGTPDTTLGAHAVEVGARAIVVAALGSRAGSPFTLGSTADRIAQCARSPVVIVRDAAPFEAWAAGREDLALLVALDDSSTSDAAVRWIADVKTFGNVASRAVHVYWPADERGKRAPRSTASSSETAGHVQRELEIEWERSLAARITRAAPGLTLPIQCVGGFGRCADHVLHVAEEQRTDAIVLGTHQRGGLARFWHGSVSHGVIDRAATNVVVVPEPA